MTDTNLNKEELMPALKEENADSENAVSQDSVYQNMPFPFEKKGEQELSLLELAKMLSGPNGSKQILMHSGRNWLKLAQGFQDRLKQEGITKKNKVKAKQNMGTSPVHSA